MNLLNLKNINKSHTDKILFDNCDFSLSTGDKVGIVGINGTGKSTLLNILAGVISADSGEYTKTTNLKINYLSQNQEFEKGISIFDYVYKQSKADSFDWDNSGNIKSVLNKLGFLDTSILTDFLSGGQKKRLSLASVLVSHCDILILDEPTNHLDSKMASWLEDFLINTKFAIIMVTHDRYFLDRVSNRIIEIDNTKIYNYEGNYQKFLEQKAMREDIQKAQERKRQSILRVELEWMRRGARARSTKQKAHIQRFEELNSKEGLTEKLNVEMSSVASRLGKKTIELSNISKSYGDLKLINDFSYTFLNFDRIGIIGDNGCGKSTLLKIINNIIEPDSGQIDIGQTVKIGYFSQENEYLNESIRVIDYIKETAEFIQTNDGMVSASTMLNRFLFDDTLQYQLIKKLSGGEKRRLYLLNILMSAPNVLILDEPTNDLDIMTLSILEDYLESFNGIVITVSHDRYFLNRVVSKIFAFTDNGYIKSYPGNYDDYLSKQSGLDNVVTSDSNSNNLEGKKNVNFSKPREEKLKMSYNEKREFETIDNDIKTLEEKVINLEKLILDNSKDFIKLNEYMKEKEVTEEKLLEMLDRWVYLNDLNERINNNIS